MVTREEIRKTIARVLTPQLIGLDISRIRYPGMLPIDVSVDKSLYVNIDIIYIDGWTSELGSKITRKSGTIVFEVNYKQGNIEDIKLTNRILDTVEPSLSNTDSLMPLRTLASKQVSSTRGAEEGFMREALVTPFWYDSSIN